MADFTVGVYSPATSETSEDGTIKCLFITGEGKRFETVFLPEKKRKTVYVSTQAGYRMDYSFCMTGRYGFNRNFNRNFVMISMDAIFNFKKKYRYYEKSNLCDSCNCILNHRM